MENDFIHWYFDVAFDVAVFKKEKQEFEDFFCDIFELYDNGFERVKPHGKTGDDSCDGYNNVTRDFYCCYAPEDLLNEKTILNAKNKIKNDIKGLVSKWPNVKTIIYIINDKSRGLPPLILHTFEELREEYSEIPIKIITAKDLKIKFLGLKDYEKQMLVGFIPNFDTETISTINFDIVSKIIKHIEKNPNIADYDDSYVVPDFKIKMEYNNLSQRIKDYLNSARYNIIKVEDFFNKNPNYSAQILKNCLTKLYQESKTVYSDEVEDFSNKRFIFILLGLCYKEQTSIMLHAMVIMAKYFESCDIFEKPPKES